MCVCGKLAGAWLVRWVFVCVVKRVGVFVVKRVGVYVVSGKRTLRR